MCVWGGGGGGGGGGAVVTYVCAMKIGHLERHLDMANEGLTVNTP